MRRIVWSAVFLMLLSVPARAVVIYTDFGPGNSFNSSGVAGAVTSTIGEAFEFTAAAAGLVSSIDFAANVTSGTPTYTVRIAADAANHPGLILDSMTATGLTTTPSVVNALSTLHPLLLQGTKYWIEITAGDATLGNTFVNNQSVLGLHARSDDAGSTWGTPGLSVLLAFDVNGNPAVTVPEPSSLALVGAGLVGFVLIRRRRKAA